MPVHFCVARGDTLKLDENEAIEFAGFAEAIGAVEQSHDFIVVDTPGTDSYLMRLAHSMADTLITPLNDSFVDFDVLGTIDPATFAVTGESHYAEMVRDARRQRRLIDGGPHRLDGRAQPSLDARLAQQAPGRRGALRARARGSASAAPTGSPSASSTASCFRAGSPRSTTSTRRRSAPGRACPMSPRAKRS